MVRTTIKISEEVDGKIRHEAAVRGLTYSEVIRQVLEEHVGLRPKQPRRELRLVGAFESGEGDLSERVDEVLAEIFERRDRHRREQH